MVKNYCFMCDNEISVDCEVCPNCGYSFTAGEEMLDNVEYSNGQIVKVDSKDKSKFWTQLSEEICDVER